MVVGISGSPKSAWVLKLSHLQVKQIKMCHLGVYNLICTKVVHPKNLGNEHVYIEISCTLKFKVV
jgi:hypothetical protein